MLLYVRFERQEETVLKELENRRKSMSLSGYPDPACQLIKNANKQESLFFLTLIMFGVTVI